MIEKGLIIGLIVLSIHYTLQPGEIFGRLGKWLEKHTPSQLHPALFECNVCMAPYYGTALYWLIYRNSIAEWLIVVIVSMGFNIVINKWAPPDPPDDNSEEIKIYQGR